MAIKDRNKKHNLQHELIYLQEPEASFTGGLVLLSAVERDNIDKPWCHLNQKQHFLTGDAINSRR